MKLSHTSAPGSATSKASPDRRIVAAAICVAVILSTVTLSWLGSSAANAAPASALPATPGQTGPVRAYFAPAASDDPAGVYLNLIKFLDTAKVSIHASAHEVDLVSVSQKLAEKAAKGVDVTLIVEQRWWESPKNKAARLTLERGKIKVVPDNRESGLMHNKFFVVDSKRVWMGSTNVTETCMLFNANASLWIDLPKIAECYETEFAEELKGKFGKKRSGKSNTPEKEVTFSGGVIRAYFGPEDDPLEAMVAQINSAKKTIDVMCFVFSSQEASEAMIRAHQRGVKVRVLLDNLFKPEAATARWKYVPAHELLAKDIPVLYDRQRAKLHHKCVIVDNRVVCVGSMNISKNGADENDENMVVLQSLPVAKLFTAQFDQLWNLTREAEAAAAAGAADPEVEKEKDDDGQQ
jgi:phosphatidylserine/phosphatidylglycerophosphate/cardiolipin synthase-like enzyme